MSTTRNVSRHRGYWPNSLSPREVRLGSVQRQRLEDAAAAGGARCGPANPSYRRLLAEGFVTSEQHISARTGEPTLDRLYRITEDGRRYLVVGRDR